MVGNKKILGLFALVTLSTSWLLLKADESEITEKTPMRVEEAFVDTTSDDTDAVEDTTRLATHKQLIYKDTDLIIRNKNGEVVFQVLSEQGKMEVKRTESGGKKAISYSYFTVDPKNGVAEVNRGKMKVGTTELTVSTGNVSAGGDMSASNVTVSGDVSAAGSVKADSMLPLTPAILSPNGMTRGIEAGTIKITDGVFSFGPDDLACTMDASTGQITVPAGMFYGKESVSIDRQFAFGNDTSALETNYTLTVMAIAVPAIAATRPVSFVVDLTYMADAASEIDEYGSPVDEYELPTYVGSGYSHIRYLVTVYGTDLSVAPMISTLTSEDVYDHQYHTFLATPLPTKIVKMLSPRYVPGDEYGPAYIIFQVSNTSSGEYGDPVNDIDNTAFTSPGVLVNQFVHARITANIAVVEFATGFEIAGIISDPDQEPVSEVIT